MRSLVVRTLLMCGLLMVTGGCGDQGHPFTQEQFTLDTLCRITVYDLPKEQAQTAVARAFGRVSAVDQELNNQNPDGLASKISRLPVGTQFPLPENIASLLETMLGLAKETSGAYDLTVSPLMALYGFYRPADAPQTERSYRVPTETEIKKAMGSVGYQGVHLEGRRLRLDRPGLFLDFGSIGKGFALGEAVTILQENGVKSALLDFGGNVAVIGAPSRGGLWQIGIQNPRGEGVIGKIPLKDTTVSTSGDYQRFFIQNGRRYHHILNATTGRPVEGLAAVIVIHPSASTADALSTAAFVMGPQKALPLIEKHGGLGIIIEDRNGQLIARASSSLSWEPSSKIRLERP